MQQTLFLDIVHKEGSAGDHVRCQAVDQGARVLLSQVAEGSLTMKRRDAVQDLNASRAFWLQGMTQMLRSAVRRGAVAMSTPGGLPLPAPRAASSSGRPAT